SESCRRETTMQITCPTCHHVMTVKDAKPGQYKPKCAKCGERFALTIFSDTRSAQVEALAEVTANRGEAASPVAAVVKGSAGLDSTMAAGVATTLSPPAKRPQESPAPGAPPAKQEPARHEPAKQERGA